MKVIILSISFLGLLLISDPAWSQLDTTSASQKMDRLQQICLNESEWDQSEVQKTLEESIEGFLKASYPLSPAQRVLAITQKLRSAKRFDRIIDLLTLLENWSSGDRGTILPPAQLSRLFFEKAVAFFELGKFDQVSQYAEMSLSLENSLPDPDALKIADRLNLAGIAYSSTGEYLKAIDLFVEAIDLRVDKLGFEHATIASLYNNVGIAYNNLGLHPKATFYLEEAMNINESLLGPFHVRHINPLVNLGLVHHDKGDYQQAIEYFEKALVILLQTGEDKSRRLADVYVNLGTSYLQTKAIEEAMLHFDKAKILYEQQNGAPDRMASIYYSMGNAYVESEKNTAKAIPLLEKALYWNRLAYGPEHPKSAEITSSLGLVYSELDSVSKAIQFLDQTQKLVDGNKNFAKVEAGICQNLSTVFLMNKDLPNARLWTQRALTIQRGLYGKKHPSIGESHNELAKIYRQEGQTTKAMENVQLALIGNHETFESRNSTHHPRAEGFIKYEPFFKSLLLKAELIKSEKKGDKGALLASRNLYFIADTVLMNMQNQLAGRADKINLANFVYQLAEAAIANCMELYALSKDPSYWEEAFFFAERSKSNVLLASISINQAKQFAGIPDSLIELEKILLSDIQFYSLQLAQHPDDEQTTLFKQELFDAKETHRFLNASFERDYGKYFELKYKNSLPKVKELQQKLSPDSEIYSYFSGDTSLFVFKIGQNTFQVYQQPFSKKFRRDTLVAYRQSLALDDLDDYYLQTAHPLYKKLFPEKPSAKVKKLYLIPDGHLAQIPFEALLTSRPLKKDNQTFAQLDYLIKNFEMEYSPSSGLLYQKKFSNKPRGNTNNQLIAFAPVFSDEPNLELPTSTRSTLDSLSKGTTRAFAWNGRRINPLPGTETEVSGIDKICTSNQVTVLSFLKKQATEAQLKMPEISKARYLHIATHGFVHEEYPDLSGLLMYPESGSYEDHILYAGEIYNLPLNAELVVLSACETGLGTAAKGEGLLGMSRAFLYAGVKNLAVSLWQVNDESTAILMEDFYKKHFALKNDDFSKALAFAKLEMIQSEKFAHPRYWSAFIMIQ